MSTKRLRRKKGFTLIELLIVFVIMSLLTGLGIGAFMTSRLRARDAKRKTDIQSIARALELYYNDFGIYPPDSALGPSNGLILGSVNWGSVFTVSGVTYMTEVPQDPSGNQYYYVMGPAGQSFGLYARLENEEDEGQGVVPIDSMYTGPVCVAGEADSCNYGLSSSNATPGDLTPL